MASSLRDQFGQLVASAAAIGRAHLCVGDSSSALVWDETTEITVRLALRADEVWLLAGSGLLVRFVASSEATLDVEGILDVVKEIICGNATEFFGVASGAPGADQFATGFQIASGSTSGGLGPSQSAFQARLAGPLARAQRVAEDAE